MSQAIQDYLDSHPDLPTPSTILDLKQIAKNYDNFAEFCPNMAVYYAVKANSTDELLQVLIKKGSSFDTASIEEIRQMIRLGADPAKISFGNTIKKLLL